MKKIKKAIYVANVNNEVIVLFEKPIITKRVEEEFMIVVDDSTICEGELAGLPTLIEFGQSLKNGTYKKMKLIIK